MIRSLPLSSDNYNLLVLLLTLSKYRDEGSGVPLASSLGLDIINNVCESRDSLHRMTDDFRIRNANLAKPNPYKAGDYVLISTNHVNLSLTCKKLSPFFIGSFTIRSFLGTNVVCLNYSERFQLLNPTVNIAYLRPYRLRTCDIGPPPKSLSDKPVEVELDGSSWYLVEDILDHRGKWVRCVSVSSVGKISMSFMTLGLVVNSSPRLYFKLMSSF
jgi:hypothetical protein